ncbi:MAG: S-layer protein, partial [Dialister sp.]|nr:S-layer protein [Dialister sp.]
RIKVKADVNDSTTVNGRFASSMNFKTGGGGNTTMDRIYVHHQFCDNFGVDLGRAGLTLGQTGILYDDAFDGVQATMGTKEVTLQAGYGRMKGWNGSLFEGTNPEAWYARLSGNAGPVALSAEYIDVAHAKANEATYWGAGMTLGLGDKADIFGDYYKNTEKEGKPYLWTAGLGLGQTNMKKPGSFRVAGQYVKAKANAYISDNSTYTVFPLNSIQDKDVDFWLINADVVLAKNVRLHGEYAFDVDAKGDNTKYDDLATVSLNYVF